MELQKITDNVFYYPHQPETDRPMLAYVRGEKFALAIDAGNSANHVDEFYKSLENSSLAKPDCTVITHWHWDHTFGLHHIYGLSIAHRKTNEYLNQERAKLGDSQYLKFMKRDDKCLAKEYESGQNITVVLAYIQFETEITLNLGGMTAKIFHAESPHSDDTSLIYIPEAKVLFLGDSTSEDFFNNGYMDKNKLKKLINIIENIECQYCMLSHTEPLVKPDLLHYLKNL